jgi:hypothetical protein
MHRSGHDPGQGQLGAGHTDPGRRHTIGVQGAHQPGGPDTKISVKRTKCVSKIRKLNISAVCMVICVKTLVVLYVVTRVSEEHTASISIFYPKDGDDTFLRNVGTQLQNYTALQPRRPQSTFSALLTPQI